MTGKDPFYIGYAARPTAEIKRFMRRVVALLVGTAVVLAVVLTSLQRPFASSFFEFGHVREFEGVIQAGPYALLLVTRPGRTDQNESLSRYPLVAFGKKGASEIGSKFGGQHIGLRGSLIYRDGQTMVEVVEGSVHPIQSAEPGRPASHSVGVQSLVGEIVDSKCFLGVMNPGNLKTHKACAIRCISGGIPPFFVVRDASNHVAYYLLVSKEGLPVNMQVLDKIAEPLRIVGEVFVEGQMRILKADPMGFERL